MSDDVIATFSSSSEEERQFAFEQSTLTLVLKQLGAPDGYVKGVRREKEEGYTFDWFNNEFGLDAYVTARRCFRFSLENIFRRPSKSPVLQMYKDVIADSEDWTGQHLVLVFKAYELGRLVLTTMPLDDRTYVHVDTGGIYFNVTTFAGFFSEHFGTPLEDL